MFRQEQLQQDDTIIQKIEIPPNTSVDMHYHKNSLEVFYILSGKGQMMIDGTLLELVVGDCVMCEPGDLHDANNPYDEAFQYIVFKTNATKDDIYWL